MKKICILLSLLLLIQPAWGQKKKKPKTTYDPNAIKSLEQVFKHLDSQARHSRNARARALGEAYDALQTKKTARARVLAGVALGDPLFSDYAQWLTASAFELDAQTDVEAGKKNAAAARQAFSHFRVILNGSPYSPLLRAVPRQLGESEVLLAYALPPGRASTRHFEEGFMRLGMSGGLSEISPSEVLAFAKSCRKAPDQLCSPWILRLTERMDRQSDEFASIAGIFPIVRDRPRKPELPPRPTQSYRAPDLDSAAFDDAMASCFAENWSDAEDKLEKFIQQFPKSNYRYRARYWLAKVLIQRDKKDDAQKQYASLEEESPLSYYGLLSAIDTGKPIDQQISSTFPQAVDRDPLLSASETYHLHRAEVLLAAKAYGLAALDLRDIRPRNALTSPFLMYLCALNYRAKNYPSLFGLLSELIQREYPLISSNVGLKMIFPVENISEIQKQARDEKIDPLLVLSLIKQESAFDPRAVSGAGAAGLMQLMYFTATQMAPGISRDDLLDPKLNIRTGTRYLANLLTRYHGNIVFALAAYNAGPIATDRWVREGQKQKLDMLSFIESIPYRETREYVSSIIRNYYWYSKIMGAKLDPKPLSYFWKAYSSS